MSTGLAHHVAPQAHRLLHISMKRVARQKEEEPTSMGGWRVHDVFVRLRPLALMFCFEPFILCPETDRDRANYFHVVLVVE